MQIEQTRCRTVGPGLYNARLEEIEYDEGQYGGYLKLRFEVPAEQTMITGVCSAKFSPKSKLYGWAKALFGAQQIPLQYNLDTSDLLGRDCRLQVEVKTTADGEFNRVKNVLPAANGDNSLPPWEAF